MKHPMQPIVLVNGVARFKQNVIVRHILDVTTSKGIFDLNQLSIMFGNGMIPQDDYDQFMQLIGYSVSGYGELSNVSTDIVEKADKIVEEMVK